MTMAWNIEKLRATGNSADAQIADILELRLEARGDFDFPDTQINAAEYEAPKLIVLQRVGETALRPPQKFDQLSLVTLADSNEPTVAELMATSNLDDYVDAIESIPELNAEIQHTLSPLISAAKRKMPSIAQSKDKRIWGGVKKSGTTEWEYSQRVGQGHMNYEFTLTYDPSHTANELRQLRVALGNREFTHYGDINMTIDFENDIATKIEIELRDPSSIFFRELLAKSIPLQVPADISKNTVDWEYDVLGGRYMHYGARDHKYHKFLFGNSLISFESASAPEYQQYQRESVEREYDPTTKTFIKKRIGIDSRITYGEPVPNQDVIALIGALANLVPIRSLDDVSSL